jgi:hypothetical protein
MAGSLISSFPAPFPEHEFKRLAVPIVPIVAIAVLEIKLRRLRSFLFSILSDILFGILKISGSDFKNRQKSLNFCINIIILTLR